MLGASPLRSFAFVFASLAPFVGCIADELTTDDVESAVGSGSGSGSSTCSIGSGSGSAAGPIMDALPRSTADNRFLGLALDGGNAPWLVYLDNGAVAVAHKGATWTTDTVDAASTVGGPAIAYGPTMAITYFTSTNHLRYARRSGTSWIIEEVTANTGPWWYQALAFDSSGAAHVAFWQSGTQLVHGVRTTAGWTFDVAATVPSGNGGPISLVMAGTQPRIAYLDTRLAQLHYVARGTNGYTNQLVRTIGVKYDILFKQNVSLALDTSGNPHIAYHDEALAQPFEAHVANGAWVVESINPNDGGYPVLDVDCANGLHALVDDDGLMLDTRGAQWWNEWYLGTGYGRTPALAIDSNGRIHAAHFDFTPKQIRYLERQLEN